MNFEHHWNTYKVAMGEYGFLYKPGLLYTEGLGPCIGLCLAYKGWAGIMHSSHSPHDEEKIGEMVAETKRAISADKIPLVRVRPVLCGSDPECDEDDDPEEYEEERLEARQKIINILKAAGFGEPHIWWSTHGETAAVYADLVDLKIFVEVD